MNGLKILINFMSGLYINGYSEKLTIDRINNNQGYMPENCRWATKSEQVRNRSISRFQESDIIYIRENPDNLSQIQLAKKYDVNQGAICRILNRTRFKDL